MGAFVWLIIIGTSIWVYIDAKRIGVKKGQLDGFCDLGAGAWAVVCLLLWIIGFPAYLIKRGEYIKINRGAGKGNTASNKNQPSHRDSSPSEKLSPKELLQKGIDFYKSGDYTEALSVLDQVISLDAKKSAAYFIRGVIYNKLGIVNLKSAANLGHKKSQDMLGARGIET